MPLSNVITGGDQVRALKAPTARPVTDGILSWSAPAGPVFWYRIYRSNQATFICCPATSLTYVDRRTTRFQDMGGDLDGKKLEGPWHYAIAALEQAGNESAPTEPVMIR